MKAPVILSLLLFSLNVFAVDSKQFCEFLLSRAEVDSRSQLRSKDTIAQVDEILAMAKQTNNFLELAREGIEKKMTWNSFQKYAQARGANFSNFFQPQYDGMYLRKYCGDVRTESSVEIKNGVVKQSSRSTSFQLLPSVADHEYAKQVPGAK